MASAQRGARRLAGSSEYDAATVAARHGVRRIGFGGSHPAGRAAAGTATPAAVEADVEGRDREAHVAECRLIRRPQPDDGTPRARPPEAPAPASRQSELPPAPVALGAQPRASSATR